MCTYLYTHLSAPQNKSVSYQMETVTHYFLGRQNHLEKEMATYSSTLAWKITWMEEAGRLQSMRSQRAGHD